MSKRHDSFPADLSMRPLKSNRHYPLKAGSGAVSQVKTGKKGWTMEHVTRHVSFPCLGNLDTLLR
jgi:hypothetical protein